MAHLQCLNIDSLAGDDMPLRIFTGGAPSLRHVIFNGVAMENCLPLTAITNFQLHDSAMKIDTTGFHFILTSLSALTHMLINIDIYVD